MSREQTYICDRCEAEERGENAYMNAAPDIMVQHSTDYPIRLSKVFAHVCENCECELDELIQAAITEWKVNK